MNKMLIRVLFATIIVLTVVFRSSSTGVKNLYTNVNDTILPLKERSYYNKIFTKAETKELTKAYKKSAKGEKFLKAYFTSKNEYIDQDKYASIVSDNAKQKKANKKAAKALSKSYKYGFKAMDYFAEANTDIYNLYFNKLDDFDNDNTLDFKFDTLKFLYKNKYDTSLVIRKNAYSLNDEQRLDKYVLADNIQLEAIKLQEFAFGLFYSDSAVIDSVNKYFEKPIDKSVYSADNDPNVYNSKFNEIFRITGLTDGEKIVLKNIEQSNINAEQFENLSVKYSDKALESKSKADAETSFVLRKKYLNEFDINNKTANENLVYSAENYYDANLKLYNLYAKKIIEFRPADSSEVALKGMVYEESADNYYTESEITFDKSTSIVASAEKYVGIMKANEYLLIAIQYIENAFCKYLNLPVTDVKDITVFQTKEEIAEFYETESKKDTVVIVENVSVIENVEVQKKDSVKVIVTTDTVKVVAENKTEEIQDTAKIKFIYDSSWFYTSENTELQKLSKEKGVSFKVQAGIFKDLLNAKDYKNYEPITVDKFKDTKLIRILVGEYQTTEAAEYALEKIKTKYKDAYIVGFVDGSRTTYAKAKLKLVKDDNYTETVLVEKAKIDGTEYVAKEVTVVATEKTEDISTEKTEKAVIDENSVFITGKDITEVKTMVYLIQLGTYQLPQTKESLKNLSNIYTLKTGENLTRYMLGIYYKVDDANKKLKEVQKLGFSDAYVTAFNEGKEIDVAEATNIEEVVETANKVTYKVQVAAFVLKITDEEFYIKYPALKGKYVLTSYTSTDNLIAYAVGNCDNYNDAFTILNELTALGIDDKYIVAFKGQQKITIAEAKKLTEK